MNNSKYSAKTIQVKTMQCPECGELVELNKHNQLCSNCFACVGCEQYQCPHCMADIVIKAPKPYKSPASTELNEDSSCNS